jgi:hypothetical protein
VSSELVDYYDALLEMNEQKQTTLAEADARNPKLLTNRFLQGVKTVASREGIVESFHDSKRKDPRYTEGVDVTSTITFVSHLCDGRTCTVKDNDALAFRYLDREIFPGRTTGAARVRRHSLDLLLANSQDDLPVFAELKIRGDRSAYFALVQILMLAAEFQSPAQRERLRKYYSGSGLNWVKEGPFADVYVIAYAPPKTGRYRERSFDASKKISEHLMAEARFTRYIRRIAYLEASVENRVMLFEKRFAFGLGL